MLITNEGIIHYYKVKPFRLEERTVTQQWMIHSVFNDEIGRRFKACVDDLLMKSKKEVSHVIGLQSTFKILRQH